MQLLKPSLFLLFIALVAAKCFAQDGSYRLATKVGIGGTIVTVGDTMPMPTSPASLASWTNYINPPSERRFLRMDTIQGVVFFVQKGVLATIIDQAIQVDSVVQDVRYSNSCPEGRVGCLVLHFNRDTVEEHFVKAVITQSGREINLNKNYTFMADSEMQDAGSLYNKDWHGVETPIGYRGNCLQIKDTIAEEVRKNAASNNPKTAQIR